MGDSYVDLMWRVVQNRQLIAGFLNLADAEEFAKKIGGKVVVITHKEVEPS
jgi:hypothetical protein